MPELKPVESDLYSTTNASKTDIGGKVAEHLVLLQDKYGAVYTPDGKTQIAEDLVELYDHLAKIGWVEFNHTGGDNIVRHIHWTRISGIEKLVNSIQAS